MGPNTGRPPSASMARMVASDTLTSTSTRAPGWRDSRSQASSARMASGSCRRPVSSTTPSRSPSPSQATPRSALCATTAVRSPSIEAASCGSAGASEPPASGSRLSPTTSQPARSSAAGPAITVAPWPASATTLSGRRSAKRSPRYATYSGSASRSSNVPGPCSKSSASISARSPWIADADSGIPSDSSSFSPLTSRPP